MAYTVTTACVGREKSSLLFFVGDCSHPAYEAVKRCNECFLAGKVPTVEDIAAVESVPFLDELDVENSDLLIV